MIFLTEFDILDREANDEIRKITSVSYICENENNVKWIPFYTKKIRHLLHVIFLRKIFYW